MRIHPLFNNHESPTKPSKYSKGQWKLVECEKTGFVYLDNPVAYQDLESTFAWEKTYQAEHQSRKEREPIFCRLSALTKKIRKAIRPIPKVESLPIVLAGKQFQEKQVINFLDVGCGDGMFTSNISAKMQKELGKMVIPRGIEISKTLAETSHERLAQQGGEVVQAAAVEGMLKLPDQSQEMILLHSFLEHETQPVELLQACSQKLTSDGLLIIKVPNFGSLNRKIRQNRWCGFRYPDHVNYFNPETIRLFLDKAGLKVFRMNFFDRIPSSDNLWVIAQVK